MKLLLIVLLALNKSQDYRVLSNDDPQIDVLIENFIETETCNFNSAIIYHLPNNRFIILPITGNYAILYYNRETLDSHIRNRFFPIDKPELDSIFELEKENIEDINHSASIYIDYVKSRFCLEQQESIKINQIENHISLLQKKIDLEGFKKLSKYDILAIGVYLSNLFKLETNAEWNLDMVFTLNTYWTPTLVSENGTKYNIIGDLFNTISEHEFCDLIHSYRFAKAKYYGLKNPLSYDFLNYVSTGKLPN